MLPLYCCIWSWQWQSTGWLPIGSSSTFLDEERLLEIIAEGNSRQSRNRDPSFWPPIRFLLTHWMGRVPIETAPILPLHLTGRLNMSTLGINTMSGIRWFFVAILFDKFTEAFLRSYLFFLPFLALLGKRVFSCWQRWCAYPENSS